MFQRGFTLIELLIVVAIIAILAAIAVPNFLEAQVRAKVSRTKTDMRTLATALEAYRIDNNKYAPMSDRSPGDPPNMNYWNHDGTDPSFHSRIPNFITTPIAYITSVGEDVFMDKAISPFAPTRYPAVSRVGFRYTYFNYQVNYDNAPTAGNAGRIEQTGGWMFFSFGPDRVNNAFNTPGAGPNRVFTRYDPTNGTVSFGNIIRTQRSSEGHIPFNSAFSPIPNTNGPN